nr:hypothetical protein BHE74_00057536 [Ipomoea trifida]
MSYSMTKLQYSLTAKNIAVSSWDLRESPAMISSAQFTAYWTGYKNERKIEKNHGNGASCQKQAKTDSGRAWVHWLETSDQILQAGWLEGEEYAGEGSVDCLGSDEEVVVIVDDGSEHHQRRHAGDHGQEGLHLGRLPLYPCRYGLDRSPRHLHAAVPLLLTDLLPNFQCLGL